MLSIKKILAPLFLSCSLGVTFSQQSFTNSLAVQRADGSTIRYYLDVAEDGGPSDSLLVILQGSDSNSVRNVKAIAKLKKVYPAADLLTLEKYGITDALAYSDDPQRPDCPAEYIEHDCPDQRVADADAVIKALRAAHGYSKIVVIGGSEGSVVANLLTSRVDYISATVLFGGGGRLFLDDVLHSMKFTTSSEEERSKNAEGFTEFADYVLSHGPFALSMGGHGYLWWRGMLSIDQEKPLSTIGTPVLVVQGGADESASPEKATEMVRSLQSRGKKNIDYLYYPGYDHSLNLSKTDDSSEKVLADIRAWLAENVG